MSVLCNTILFINICIMPFLEGVKLISILVKLSFVFCRFNNCYFAAEKFGSGKVHRLKVMCSCLLQDLLEDLSMTCDF